MLCLCLMSAWTYSTVRPTAHPVTLVSSEAVLRYTSQRTHSGRFPNTPALQYSIPYGYTANNFALRLLRRSLTRRPMSDETSVLFRQLSAH